MESSFPLCTLDEADIEVSVSISVTVDEYMVVVEGVGVTITVIDASIGNIRKKNVLVVEAEV